MISVSIVYASKLSCHRIHVQ